jgi:hypothetical protein
MMIGHTSASVIRIRLPASIDERSTLNILVHIRDRFDSISEFHLPPITIRSDYLAIKNFLDNLQKTNSKNDTISQLLNNGDPNTLGQLTTSISQLFNEINHQAIQLAAMSIYSFEHSTKIIHFPF